MDATSIDYRPHRTTSINSTTTTATATTELFICFTSRLSYSSSMKISSNSNSKSILSPGRARDHPSQQISLSSSLSRRLRTNGSLKGGQASPMFHAGRKKRSGAGYENPEPSSPKVTCIGQVRVKTKKKQQAKKLRNGSQRKGEVSFRKLELSRSGHHSNFQQHHHLGNTPEGLPHRNQRWVNFPVSICEALRTFGADWNCFLPCRSSCMTSKEDKAGSGSGGGGNGGSSCGAVIARWLVSVQDGEGNGRREIELVVGGEEMDNRSYRSQRRHIFEGLDFSEVKEAAAAKEDGGRVSISIPPKNALLLMRCRSDPVKVAALANRFCERSDEDNEKDGQGEAEEVTRVVVEEEVKFEQEMEELNDEESEDQNILEEAESSLMVEEEEVYEEVNDLDLEPESQEKMKEEDDEEDEELELLCGFLFREAEEDDFVDATGDDDDGSKSARMDEAPELDESVNWEAEEDAEKLLEAETRPKTAQNLQPDDGDPNRKPKVREREDSRLPECLLLMMCEPKLSMEVSKETWVCSTDFIRWLPERHSNKAAAHGVEEEPVKKRNSTDRRPRATGLTAHQTRILHQPPRNSVSFPAQAMLSARRSSVGSGDGGESMAAVIEKKLRSAKAGEPLALTRCKSEPLRSDINLAAPDSCFWKNRKLEPHRPPGVKAAGVGF